MKIHSIRESRRAGHHPLAVDSAHCGGSRLAEPFGHFATHQHPGPGPGPGGSPSQCQTRPANRHRRTVETRRSQHPDHGAGRHSRPRESTSHRCLAELGREQSPDHGQPRRPAHQTRLRRETKNTSKNGRFLTWLVSAANPVTSPGDAANLVKNASAASTVPLVSSGSLAAGDKRQVHVAPVPVYPGGTFAWWVSGENQKAHLPKPYEPKTDTAVAWSDYRASTLREFWARRGPIASWAKIKSYATLYKKCHPHPRTRRISSTRAGWMTGRLKKPP